MKQSKKAITLTEIIITTFLATLLIVSLMKLLSSGMKGSTKGLAHQSNMETATVLMSQIELDLLKAVKIISPNSTSNELNQKKDSACWEIECEDSNNKIINCTVTYTKIPGNGINRHIVFKDGKTQDHIFAKDHEVELNFTRFIAVKSKAENVNMLKKKYLQRHGMWIDLTVSTKNHKTNEKKESIYLKRLILARSHIDLTISEN